MSTGNFQQNTHSLPVPSSTPSASNTSTSRNSTPNSQLEGQVLGEEIRNSPSLSSSQPYVMLPPHSQAQQGNLPQNILSNTDYSFHIYNGSRHQNLYLFATDSSAVNPQSSLTSSLEEKERGKVGGGTVTSSRIINNTCISSATNLNSKPFVALQISDSKNDKMISGFDRRLDNLSPLSVIAVPNYSDTGHSSPNLSGNGLTQSQQALRYQPGSDAMLSAINYSESDMLQEGGFDVPVTSAFGNLDGLLGSIGGGVSSSGMRLPDLLDGDGSQEPYMDAGQDLQLSPESFTAGTEGFPVENTPLSRITDPSAVECTEENTKPPETGNSTLSEKVRAKSRPIKATSPSRPGTQPCPTCGKVFSNSSALTKHKLTHSDERKYVCQLCTKAFKRQDHLNGHMLTHRNKKPYECDVEGCGKSYCDARSLRRHKENHHSNSCNTGNVTVPSLGSHLTVIPSMAHLGFTSLPPSFPASVITSSSDQIFSETTENGNRIQYAPAPATSQSVSPSDFNSENNTRSTDRQIMSSVVPTAASQLHFLAFHQQSQAQFQSQNKNQSLYSSPSMSGRTDNRTILSPWQPQTINTSALLLAQNFGSPNASQASVSQQQNHQMNISETIDASTDIRSRTSPSNLSQQQKPEMKKIKEEPKMEPHSCENQQQTTQSQSSENFMSSPIRASTSHSSTGAPVSFSHAQLSSDHNLDIGTNVNSTDNLFSQHPVSLSQTLLQSEISASNNATMDSITTSVSNISAVSDTEQSQMNSPLLQQLLTPPQHIDLLSSGSDVAVNSTNCSIARAAFLQQALLASAHQHSLQQQNLFPNWNQVSFALSNMNSNNSSTRFTGQDSKPVECGLCQRKFKNIPALNGHMRLHGGYFKKENDLKKADRKQNNSSQQPSLQTASTNVRALIEEKIIQKRTSSQNNTQLSLDIVPLGSNFFQSTEQQNVVTTTSSVNNTQFGSINVQPPALSPVSQENTLFSDFPVTSQNNLLYDNISTKSSDQDELASVFDWQKEVNDLKEQFRVPRPPGEKLRRHSDSDHFIPSKRLCPNYTKSALADLLRKKVVAKRTSRTGSDPGEPFLHVENSLTNSSPSTPGTPNPPSDLTPHISLSTEHPLSLITNQNLSSIKVEDSDLPVLLDDDLTKSSSAEVCLSTSVLSSVNQVLSTSVCSTNDSDLQKKNTNNPTNTSSPHWSYNVPLHFFGNELQPPQNSVTVPSSLSCGNTNNSIRSRIGEDSNDDDVFLSPVSLPTSPLKTKRKHRPEPLYIPPYVNNCGFTSRLRSPRLWDPSNPDNKNASPPPYTPPPMLSPVRSGSGLFWHIISGSGSLTPKSAPITPSFSLIRRNSTNEVLPEEEEFIEVPETDILPHVNIGSQFQARLPPFNPNRRDALKCEDKADKVWDPKIIDNLTDFDLDMYLELSCSSVMPGGGKNKEYAMHTLNLTGGNIQEAILRLMNPNPLLPADHPLLTFLYPETDRWTPEEIEAYHQSMIRYDKDFFSIAQEMQVKTVKQCIQFYYIWKKVCPEEYKRLRLIRRKREQDSIIYGSRIQGASDHVDSDNTDIVQTVNNRDLQLSDKFFDNLSGNGPSLTNGQSPTQNSLESIKSTSPTKLVSSNFVPIIGPCDMSLDPPEEFPCRICGKIFNKVKSRSAHMKSHRQTENEKKNKFEC